MTAEDMKLKLMSIDIKRVAYLSLTTNKDLLVKTQQNQLFTGKRYTGANISPKYKASTIAAKTRKGQPIDRVTLKDKGDFYEGIKVDINDDEFSFASKDWKNDDLVDKYKESIFGLNKDSRISIVPMLQDSFVRLFKTQAGL